MRFVFLWLCAILLFSGVVYGESDRDSLKVRLGEPRLNLGTPVLLTDSIPGAFIERLDELYSKWYVSKLEEGNYVDSVYLTEMVTGSGSTGFCISETVGSVEFCYKAFL